MDKKSEKSLTAKQQAFCEEYLIDLNATQAAIRAGYSEHTAKDIACENLAKPNIAEKIAELKAERSKRVKIDADYVLTGLKELNDICMGKKEVSITNRDGATESTKLFEPAAANKSYELMGKHTDIGCFKDRLDVVHKFGDMSDDELDSELEVLSGDDND